MSHAHQLDTALRALKLSGMLDTLDARLAQAHAGDLGHIEFLHALCLDEVARRDAAAIVRRVRNASSPSPSSTDSSTPPTTST